MKKLVASTGIIAVGVASLHAAYAPGLDSNQTTKNWSASVSLKGFYDDNYDTGSTTNRHDSFGFEVSPTLGFNKSMDSTLLRGSYNYSYRWYEKRNVAGQQAADQAHRVELSLDHSFSQATSLTLSDSFAVAQEPEVLDPSLTSISRAQGDNIRNFATAGLSTQITPLFGLAVGYQNSFFDYEDSLRSDLLDRMEHRANIDLRWQVARETTALVGYAYGDVEFSRNNIIGFVGLTPVTSQSRNARSHSGYVGLEHEFTPELHGSVRVGASYFDYYNDPTGKTDISPNAKASLSYKYSDAGMATLGLKHDRNATDAVAPSGTSITQDQESTAVWGQITHRLTSKLVADVTGTFQASTFNGGIYDGQTDKTFLAGLAFTYNFNEHFSALVGYNYDLIDSDILNRGYDRSRAYIGVNASY